MLRGMAAVLEYKAVRRALASDFWPRYSESLGVESVGSVYKREDLKPYFLYFFLHHDFQEEYERAL